MKKIYIYVLLLFTLFVFLGILYTNNGVEGLSGLVSIVKVYVTGRSVKLSEEPMCYLVHKKDYENTLYDITDRFSIQDDHGTARIRERDYVFIRKPYATAFYILTFLRTEEKTEAISIRKDQDVLIDYATDDLLQQYPVASLFTEDAFGSNVLIWSNEVMSHLKIVRVAYDPATNLFIAKETLWQSASLDAYHFLQIKTVIPESAPKTKFSFVDTQGLVKEFLISWSGKDGSARLIPLSNNSI